MITKEKCIEDCLTFKTTRNWSKKAPKSFQAAINYGLFAGLTKTQIHASKYIYILMNYDYPNGVPNVRTKIRIICPEHGIFSSQLYRHKSGQRCPSCNKIKPSEYWTKEKCIESANMFRTKWGWKVKFSLAFKIAKKNGWMDECCDHMNQRFGVGYWTKKNCIETAIKFKTRSEWIMNYSSAYGAASRNGWLKECCKHMTKVLRDKNEYTLKECIENAKKYKTRSEWSKKSPGIYKVAGIKNWRERCCKEMKNIKKPNGYWSKQRCIEDAKKFNHRKEWHKKSSAACSAAYKKGWMDECCKHMKKNRIN